MRAVDAKARMAVGRMIEGAVIGSSNMVRSESRRDGQSRVISETPSANRVRPVTMNFARCLAQRGPSLAQRLLRTPSHYGRGLIPRAHLRRPALSSGFKFRRVSFFRLTYRHYSYATYGSVRRLSTLSAEYRLAEEGIEAHLVSIILRAH